MTALIPDAKRDLRAQILDEATRLFATKGYKATSIREVTDAARCTKPSLYYYFRSKEDLYHQVIEAQNELMSELIRSFVSRPGPIRPRIHEALTTVVEVAQANPHAMRLLQRAETQTEAGAPEIDISKARQFHFEMMENLIRQGIDSGEIRSDVDPSDCATALAGTINFQFQQWLCFGEEWSPPRLHRTVDMLFDGIGAR
jgi:AcrR family transcriptional regulator